MKQHIPESCDINIKLHSIDLRGQHDLDWSDVHKEYKEKWNCHRDHVVSSELLSEDISYCDPYMLWYRSMTRQYLTKHGSFHDLMVIYIYLLVYFGSFYLIITNIFYF